MDIGLTGGGGVANHVDQFGWNESLSANETGLKSKYDCCWCNTKKGILTAISG